MTDEQMLAMRQRLLRELNLRPGVALSLDSMDIMSALVAIEETTGVELAFSQLKNCGTYDELEDAVRDKAGM